MTSRRRSGLAFVAQEAADPEEPWSPRSPDGPKGPLGPRGCPEAESPPGDLLGPAPLGMADMGPIPLGRAGMGPDPARQEVVYGTALLCTNLRSLRSPVRGFSGTFGTEQRKFSPPTSNRRLVRRASATSGLGSDDRRAPVAERSRLSRGIFGPEGMC